MLAAAGLCAWLAACTSAPGIHLPQARTQASQINVYHPRQNRDVAVTVVRYLPERTAPAQPAVLLLSGCNGSFGTAARALTQQLLARGVIVAEVKSIETFGNSCSGNPPRLTGAGRAAHAFEARKHLVEAGLARVDNVALLGFSHGGWTILHASHMDAGHGFVVGNQPPFAAAVAFYPLCNTLDLPRRAAATPTLLLTGSADTWTPPDPCRTVAERSPTLSFRLFAGATHAWDYAAAPRTVDTDNGPSLLAHDEAATRVSIEASLDFLLKHLRVD